MAMEHIKAKLTIVPSQPGCYLMKNIHEEIIYVGKAVNLKSRVRSYFSGSHDIKTERLVSDIHDFEYIVTSSNLEALILEMNLIKEHDPKYNVMLKDDKSYPYIKLTNERHPRLIITRKVKKNSGRYFGPYPNVTAAQQTKKLLDRLYPLRKCRTLPDRVCLYYHIGQCMAPCVYDVSEETYEEMTEAIIKFLNGGHRRIKKDLQTKMEQASEDLNFERAKELRDQIHHIETVMEKQTMMFRDHQDRDVFNFAYDKGWMCIQVFYVRQGKLIERDVSIFPFYKEATDDVLTFIGQFYLHQNHIKPGEILIPQALDPEAVEEITGVRVMKPKSGRRRELVDLAEKNARIALKEKFALIEKEQEKTIKAVEQLGEKIGIATPSRIETFDNSNIQGVHPVSAMVVFEDGKPLKKEYRKYRIKTVKGPDDYATMREVIRRRYSRLLKERRRLPDLILVDGGRGQLTAAKDVLENELGTTIPLCGLAKDDKHKTASLINGNTLDIIDLPRNSQSFYLLQRIQDEVHRFAITFHRQIRDKTLAKSALDEVPGVGPKRKKKLIRTFGSVKAIKDVKIEEIIACGIPESVAQHIQEKLNEN